MKKESSALGEKPERHSTKLKKIKSLDPESTDSFLSISLQEDQCHQISLHQSQSQQDHLLPHIGYQQNWNYLIYLNQNQSQQNWNH